VVAEGVARPGIGGHASSTFLLIVPDPGRVEAASAHEREVEDQVELVFAAAVVSEVIGFTDQDAVGIFVNHGA